AAPLHLDGKEAGVAADVEHGAAVQVRRQRRRDASPLEAGIIAEEMVGSRADAAEVDIVEPVAELGHAPANLVEVRIGHGALPIGTTDPRVAPEGPPAASRAGLLRAGLGFGVRASMPSNHAMVERSPCASERVGFQSSSAPARAMS